MYGRGAVPLVRKVLNASGAQTNQAVWTPASGKCIVLTGVYLLSSAVATVALFIGTNTDANLLPGSGAVAANAGVMTEVPSERFAADAVIKLTTSAGNALVILYGYEEL